MRSIGKRESLAIGVVLMIVVIVAGWLLLVKPASSKVSELKAQATDQENANDATRTQIAGLQADKKKLPKEQGELAELTQKVPTTVELPNLLRSVQDLADRAGVTLVGITPSTAVPLPEAAGIDAVAVTIVTTGGYAEVEEFDHSLEGLSRAFLVTGFALSQAEQTSGDTSGSSGVAGDATVSATFNGRVLVNTTGGSSTTTTTTSTTKTTAAGQSTTN